MPFLLCSLYGAALGGQWFGNSRNASNSPRTVSNIGRSFPGLVFLHHYITAFIPHVVRTSWRRVVRFDPPAAAFDGELVYPGPPEAAHRPARGDIPDGRFSTIPHVAVWYEVRSPAVRAAFPPRRQRLQPGQS